MTILEDNPSSFLFGKSQEILHHSLLALAQRQHVNIFIFAQNLLKSLYLWQWLCSLGQYKYDRHITPSSLVESLNIEALEFDELFTQKLLDFKLNQRHDLIRLKYLYNLYMINIINNTKCIWQSLIIDSLLTQKINPLISVISNILNQLNQLSLLLRQLL